MQFEKMERVNKTHPCPICGKPDWCLIAEDGSAAICQRIQEGSVKWCGDAGWLHILADLPRNQRRRIYRSFTVGQDKMHIDFTTLHQRYSRQITSHQLNTLSQRLGVSIWSLKMLNVGWDGKAYTFPMFNEFGKVIGIRRRFQDGRKLSVPGSRTGIFIPTGLASEGLLLICEGPTDTAAALDLGFNAIGRPNCSSCVDITAKLVKGRDVVVAADGDEVGKRGAERLASTLALYCISVRIVHPPKGVKDLRQWFLAGLDNETLKKIIEHTQAFQIEVCPSVTIRRLQR
jgi:hypothetical protein